MIQEYYLRYLQEDSLEGNADLVTQLAGGGAGARLAVNLAIKVYGRLKNLFNREQNPQKKVQIQQKMQIAKQNIIKKKQQMG